MFGAVPGGRKRFESLVPNRRSACFATAVGSVLQTIEGPLDLVHLHLEGFQSGQLAFAVEGLGAPFRRLAITARRVLQAGGFSHSDILARSDELAVTPGGGRPRSPGLTFCHVR